MGQHVYINHIEAAIQYLTQADDAHIPQSSTWGPSLSQHKFFSTIIQAKKILIELRQSFNLPCGFRNVVETQITKLNALRKRDREELDKRVRDIRRVQKIISDLEMHRQSYLSHVHMFGDAEMTMDLSQRERHRNRLEEWDDELKFRRAMLAQLREKARLSFDEIYAEEIGLKNLLDTEVCFREAAKKELTPFDLDDATQYKVIEMVLNEGTATFLTIEEWTICEQNFSMPFLRQLNHHFSPIGNFGYALRSDWRYYSMIDDEWIVGNSDSQGLSFDNPSLQLALRRALTKMNDYRKAQGRKVLRSMAEEMCKDGEVRIAELRRWLDLAALFDEDYLSSLVMFSSVAKIYQTEERGAQVRRLFNMANADGVIKTEEADLLRGIERKLLMPDVRPPVLERALQEYQKKGVDLCISLRLSKEAYLEQICEMAMCDSELHEMEKLQLQKLMKELHIDFGDLQKRLQKKVS